jgi:threonine/homoserine/homoserine lactone efflux protein
MTLRLSNNALARYVQRSGYAAAEQVPLVGPLGEVAASLLAWLGAQLATGETLADVVLEASGQVATAFETQTDEDGNEIEVATAFRPTMSAAVSVTAPLGSRTFVVSSESLPSELRDGLVTTWSHLQQT